MAQSHSHFADATDLPQGAVRVNQRVWFHDLYGNRAVFVDQTPFYCYPFTDNSGHRFCAVQLVEAGLASCKQICQAFQFHPRTFSRMRSRFRKHGIAGLPLKKGGRKKKRTPTIAAGIVQLYLAGHSTYDVAGQVGLSPATVRRALKDQGVELRSPSNHPKPLVSDKKGRISSKCDESQSVESRTIESTP